MNFPNVVRDKKPPVRDREKGRWRELARAVDDSRVSVITENIVMIILDFMYLIGNIITAAALFRLLAENLSDLSDLLDMFAIIELKQKT